MRLFLSCTLLGLICLLACGADPLAVDGPETLPPVAKPNPEQAPMPIGQDGPVIPIGTTSFTPSTKVLVVTLRIRAETVPALLEAFSQIGGKDLTPEQRIEAACRLYLAERLLQHQSTQIQRAQLQAAFEAVGPPPEAKGIQK